MLVAVAAVAWGIAAGDLGGNGGGPLGILGVLKRTELDLRPVINLAAIALSAYLAPAALATRGVVVTLVATLAAIVPFGLTVHEASSLNSDATTARLVEHTGLGKSALAILRKLSDRDHDGASPTLAEATATTTLCAHPPRSTSRATASMKTAAARTLLPAHAPVVVRPDPRAAARHLDPHMNLLLITVDTMRIDLGFMGYDKPVSPNLDALAERGVVFDRAYSMASSIPARASALSSSASIPARPRATAGTSRRTFRAMSSSPSGSTRPAFARSARHHWYFVPWSGLTQGMDEWDISAAPAGGQGNRSSVTSAQLTDAAIAMLQKPESTSGRFFMWVHYFDPHEQYMPHEDAPAAIQEDADSPQKKTKAAYDAEVWFTDHHIGRLLDFITGEQPWGGSTAVVVTSDHGEAFGDHGMSFHGAEL